MMACVALSNPAPSIVWSRNHLELTPPHQTAKSQPLKAERTSYYQISQLLTKSLSQESSLQKPVKPLTHHPSKPPFTTTSRTSSLKSRSLLSSQTSYNYSFSLENVTITDTGIYTCTARNSFGSDSIAYKLVVKEGWFQRYI